MGRGRTGRAGRRVRGAAALVAVAALVAGGCAGRDEPGEGSAAGSSATTTTMGSTASTAVRPPPVVVAAGDIACAPSMPVTADQCQHQATSDLARSLQPDLALLPGDLQYDRGELDYFRASFGPSWGRLGDRLRPAPGNHDYGGEGAAGYFAYFAELGVDVGDRREGWYRFSLGDWEMFALNSNCWAIGGCGAGSPQMAWLEAELATVRSRCALAFWHHPRFSSGLHGDDESVTELYAALDAGGVDLLVAGHDHSYERFAPLTADGRPSVEGVRQFVAGTGGRSLYPIAVVRGFSEARVADRFGVLELSLGAGGYGWRFVALGGDTLDQGQDECR